MLTDEQVSLLGTRIALAAAAAQFRDNGQSRKDVEMALQCILDKVFGFPMLSTVDMLKKNVECQEELVVNMPPL